jgi:hypothetical protein
MEEDLDEISRGERESIAFLQEFYYGDKKHRGLLPAVETGAEKADYPLLDLGTDPRAASRAHPHRRFGPFVQVGEGGRDDGVAARRRRARRSDRRAALELVRAEGGGPRSLGVDPATGQNVYVMNGRFGAYVQLGETPEPRRRREGQRVEKPKRASLQAGMTETTVTLDEALQAAVAAARRRSASRRQRADRDQLRPLRSLREARRRVPLARIGRRRLQHLVRRGAGAAAAPKQSRRRQGAQKKTLRELTHDGRR